MSRLKSTFSSINQEISEHCSRCGRQDTPLLLAVSKTRTAGEIQQAFDAGFRSFGENYLQEAIGKIDQLAALPVDWHYIGNLQSNKSKQVAESFSWVHTVDRLKIAQKLSQHRPPGLAPLNVCIQVNIDQDPNKGGAPLEQVGELAEGVAQLPGLALRGLMTIPANKGNDHARHCFSKLAETLGELQATIPALDTLSMGMSGDYVEAIEAGSTILRLGTAIFGPRPNTQG